MARLEIEITDKLMDEIEAAAKRDLVTPEHWAACRLSMIFRDKGLPEWVIILPPALRNIAQAIEHLAAKSESKQ